jgi:hypothetical protein
MADEASEPRRFKIRIDEEHTYTAQIAGSLLPLNETIEVVEVPKADGEHGSAEQSPD